MDLVVTEVREPHALVSFLVSTRLDLKEHLSSVALLIDLGQSYLLVSLKNLESCFHRSEVSGILNF